MKKSFLILICLVLMSFAEKYNDIYLDSLMSDYFLEWRGKSSRIKELLKTIEEKNNSMREDAYIEYVSTRNKFRNYIFPYLIRLGSEKFILWLNENGDTLHHDIWGYICDALEKEGWNSKEIYKILLFHSLNNDDSWSRSILTAFFEKKATFKQANLLRKNLKLETSIGARQSIYTALCRYRIAEFDNTLKSLLKEKREIKALEYTLFFGFKKYNRYDLLPELINLSSKLESEKDVIKKGQYISLQKELGKTISYLEKKRDEKAPIGLPLDWGVEDLK